MIQLMKKADCCGCGACDQVCPKNCISMVADSEGFLYPRVDEKVCVNCGLCEKVCPIINRQSVSSETVAAYAGYTPDDELRQVSSSGGLFSVLARTIMKQGGAVAGAAFDEDFSVRHVLVEKQEDLRRLRGSKYVQSRMEDTYIRVRQLLKQGRPVLFTGVACQVAGLRTFLGKEYDNLYTVDVLCHGVPSPKVWQKYLAEQERRYSAKTVDVSFRHKRMGWKSFSMVLDFDNQKQYQETLNLDPYMRLFLANICLRPSCHSCRFKDFPRPADLTIGDAWGIGKHMPELDDDRGTSVVLVNSPKGRQLWDTVVGGLVYKPGQLDTLLPKDADSRRSVRPHSNRSRFFAALDQGQSLEQLVKLTRKSTYRRLLSVAKRTAKRLLRK